MHGLLSFRGRLITSIIQALVLCVWPYSTKHQPNKSWMAGARCMIAGSSPLEDSNGCNSFILADANEYRLFIGAIVGVVAKLKKSLAKRGTESCPLYSEIDLCLTDS